MLLTFHNRMFFRTSGFHRMRTLKPATNRYCRDDCNLRGLLSLIFRLLKKQEQSVCQYVLFLDDSLELLRFL